MYKVRATSNALCMYILSTSMCPLPFLYCSSYSYMKTEMKAFIDERMDPERRVLYALPSRYP
jgi:hypothetical protein